MPFGGSVGASGLPQSRRYIVCLPYPPYDLPYVNSSPTTETAFAGSLPPPSSAPFHHITQSLTGPLSPTLIPTLLPFSLPIIFPLSHFQLILRNHAGHIHASLTSRPKTPATVLPRRILLYTIPLQIPYRSLLGIVTGGVNPQGSG